MAYTEFNGELDGEEPGYIEFSGELDKPESKLDKVKSVVSKGVDAGLSMLTPKRSIADQAQTQPAPSPDTARIQRNNQIGLRAFTSAEPVPEEGGFINSAGRTIGQSIKGAGQVGADYLGASPNNPVKQYGQAVIDANPTAVNSLEDIAAKPGTAVAEGTGNAAPSMAGMIGARAVGQGITALSPLAGPAAPLVAAAGQVVSWLGPAAIAALPSYGGIRDKQILNDPAAEQSAKSKAIAAMGAATVGAIEQRFGPQQWALAAMTKQGRAALAEKFAATTLAGSIGKGAVKGAAIEGSEELAQNPIEQLAAGDNPTTPANIKDTLFGGAMGAITGGVLGGGTGMLLGKPINQVPDNVLKYTAERGGKKASEAAQAEIDRREKDGIVNNAPETTPDAVQRIIDTGKDKAREINKGAATASDSIQSSIFEEPEPPSTPDQPTPEPVETLNAQINALADGRKPGVLLTPGEPMPDTLPEGVKTADVPGHGTLLYRDDATLQAARNGQLGTALGYGIDEKPVGATYAVTARDESGNVIQDVATDGSKSVIQAAKNVAGPGGAVEVRPVADAMAEREANSPESTGIKTQVVLPDNTHLPAQWDVVDADSVSASLKQGVNQPRDRTRAASDIQLQGIANNPDYQRLADSPVMDVGAPTLSHDGAIVGGNGRFEGISRAYDQGTAGNYLANLKANAAAKGIDPAKIDGMKKPILVRRITQPFDARTLAVASNSGTSLQYSGLELAKIDAERMKGLEHLDITDSGDVALTGSNIQNIRHALSGYNAAELGALTDKDGMLSQEGMRRIKNSILYQAYGNSPTLSRIVESTDNDMRNISAALVKAAGSVAKVRAEIAAGKAPPELDISKDLVASVETLAKIRAASQSVDEHLAQAGMFGDDLTEQEKFILKTLDTHIRSQKKLTDFIRTYYDSVGKIDLSTNDIFGAETPSKQELLKNAKERITDKPAVVQDLFANKPAAKPETSSKPDTQSQRQPASNGGANESGSKDKQVDPLHWVKKYQDIAERFGKTSAEERARATLASHVIGRDFGADYIQPADIANLKKWLDDGMPLSNQAQQKPSPASPKEEGAPKPSGKQTSWVIRNKETGEVLFETFDKKKVDALNTKKYEAVPILDHLVGINKQIKEDAAKAVAVSKTLEEKLAPKTEPAPTPKPADAHPVRPLLESLIKRRAAAKQVGKERSINSTIARAKEVMEGKRTDAAADSKWFRVQAAGMRKADPATADILQNISDAINPKQQAKAGLSVADVEKHIEPLQKAGTKKIKVAASEADLPKNIQDAIKSAGAAGVRGVYYPQTDEVWLVADKLNNADESIMVALHEARHRGLRKLFGPEVAPVMRQIYGTNKRVRDAANRMMQSNKGMSKEEATEEVLADMAIDKTAHELNGWKRLVQFIQKWLADHGIKLKFTDAMVESLVAGAETVGTSEDGNIVSDDSPRFSRAGQNSSWDSPEHSKMDDLIYKLQNKHVDLKRVIQSIQTTSAQLADQWNTYLQEELFHGRAAKRTQDFVNREMKPIMMGMKLRGQSIKDVDDYLHARHAEEANKLIAARNPSDPDMQDGGSGMDTQDAKDYLANLPADKRKALENTAKQVDAVIAKTRNTYLSYGLIDQETADSWENMFKHYVPLMREDNDGGMGVGQGFSIKGKEAKHRTGSKRKVVDILANIALQRERAIVRGEKNRVAVSLAGLAKLNPNPDFWTFDKVPTNRVLVDKKNTYEVHYHGSKVMEFTSPVEAKKFVDFQGDPAYTIKKVEIPAHVEDQTDPMYKNRDNVIVAKIKDGKGKIIERAVVFNEHDERALRMATAMKNLDATQLEGLFGVSAVITRYFASINTQYNPVFGVINLIRDLQASLLNLSSTEITGHKAQVLKNIIPAIGAIYSSTRGARKGSQVNSPMANLWDEMQNEGGMTGYRELFKTSEDRANTIKHELDPTAWMNNGLGKIFTAGGALKVPLAVAQKKAKWMFDWLSDYNQTLEGAVRLSVYKVAIDNGISKQRAASIGKNISVNFNRKGQSGQQAGALYAFFNAAMQGTARMGETMTTMENGDPKTLRFNKAGKTIIAGGISIGVIQALALSAAGFDDDEPPEFVRERSLIIPIGDKKYITIPMPLGFHAIPNIGRLSTEFALGGFKKPADYTTKLFSVFAEAFNPIGNAGMSLQTIAPTAIDPLAALAENRDWTGKPIYKEDFSKLSPTPGFTRFKDTASDPAKWIAEAINTISGGNKYVPGTVSPTADQIDYLVGQITGGVGRETGKAQQSIKAAYTGEDLPPHKIPLVGRFYGSSENQSSQGNAFYSNLKRINEVEAELEGRHKDRLPLDEFKAENPEYRLVKLADMVQRAVSKQRKIKSDLIAHDAPREQVRAVEERLTKLMAGFNGRVKELKQSHQAAH